MGWIEFWAPGLQAEYYDYNYQQQQQQQQQMRMYNQAPYSQAPVCTHAHCAGGALPARPGGSNVALTR